MKRIAVDMDGVVADFNAKVITCFNERFGQKVAPDAFHHHKLASQFPQWALQIEAMLAEPGFFADLPLMPDARAVLQQLSEHYEVCITSAATDFPQAFADKLAWIVRELPFVAERNIVFCGNKSLLNAHYLIDDNIEHFIGFGGQGILFSAPHNQAVSGYPRVENWQQIATLLLS